MIAFTLMADHEEVPGVVRERRMVMPALPWWQRMAEANGITVAAIIGAAFWFGDLSRRVSGVEESLQQHRRFHETGVGSQITPEPDTRPLPAPTPEPQEDPIPKSDTESPEEDGTSEPPSEKPSRGITRGVPSTSTPRDPPQCVHYKTHRLFPCEQATQCLGLGDFNADFFREVRRKSGAGDWMMICHAKNQE